LILASPVATHPKIDEALAVPTLEPTELEVACSGALTSVYKNPETGEVDIAQLDSIKAAAPAKANDFSVFIVLVFEIRLFPNVVNQMLQ
jgi:hypothetical protein